MVWRRCGPQIVITRTLVSATRSRGGHHAHLHRLYRPQPTHRHVRTRWICSRSLRCWQRQSALRQPLCHVRRRVRLSFHPSRRRLRRPSHRFHQPSERPPTPPRHPPTSLPRAKRVCRRSTKRRDRRASPSPCPACPCHSCPNRGRTLAGCASARVRVIRSDSRHRIMKGSRGATPQAR